MDQITLARRLFPHITDSPADAAARYPARALPPGACVTRFSPSPTGFVHIGNLYGAMTDERVAHLSGGVVFLRIEDTDQKREVSGAVGRLIDALAHYRIRFDEGAVREGDSGAYGPYRQRQRAEIYQCFAKNLVERGLAYPCFCTEEELAEMRQRQQDQKVNFGYWGPWAVWRDADAAKVEAALDAGLPWVVRLRSRGDSERRKTVEDAIRGTLEFPENNQDIVLLKSDGIPTYHFAHAVDDFLMGTTHVIRADEWLASLPIHVELFETLGFPMPVYCHTATLMKQDGASKRKLSKRHDPEADLVFYVREGYPAEALREYLMTLLNSNYEDWRRDNPEAPLEDFPFSLQKMSVSGALFDLLKLRDVCKNTVARMTAAEVYAEAAEWAKAYAPDFHALLAGDPEYAVRILSIGRDGPKPRRDYGIWSELPDYMGFFYDPLFVPSSEYPETLSKDDISKILDHTAAGYDPADPQDVWFGKLKELSAALGLAPDTKTFKKNPGVYRGHVGDVSMALRVALTGRQNAPDLWEVMRILGAARVRARLKAAREALYPPAADHPKTND